MKIGVLAIQGAVAEHLKLLERCGVHAVPVKDPEALESTAGLIIPGGESTTIGKLLEQYKLAEPIRKRSAQKTLAVFGTCAGMVLMAREISDGIAGQPKLGLLDIKVRRNAFGRQRESFETELNFHSFDRPLAGVFIRAPIVEEAGPDVKVLASLPEGTVAVRQGGLLAVSFHPELTDDLRVHGYFVKMCANIK